MITNFPLILIEAIIFIYDPHQINIKAIGTKKEVLNSEEL
jgi:hypothetical protein